MITQDTWVFDHFTPSEFTCKCNGLCDHEDLISRQLVGALDRLRDIVGKRFRVSSGVRCAEYNRTVGSDDTSQHVACCAADIFVPLGMTSEELAEIAEREIPEFANGGIGKYDTFVHFDVRGFRARWDYRKTEV